jgi:hypothetical protein
MQDLLKETIDEAKKVKESALKSAEFIVRGKMASELKDNYLKLLFENDSKEEDEECEIEEVEDEEESDDTKKDLKTNKKVAPKQDDEKLIISEVDAVITSDESEDDEDINSILESFISSSNNRNLLFEQDEEEQPQEEEVPDEQGQGAEVPKDDEEMEFDLSELQNSPEGNQDAQPSETSNDPSAGIMDDPAEPKQDVKQVEVNRFPFAYDRDTFKTDGKENKNKKSRIKLQPTYEEDSPANPNNQFDFSELTEKEDSEGQEEYVPNAKNATQKSPKRQSEMVKESISKTEEHVTIPATLMLEYMDKDVQQISIIKRLEKEIQILKEQVVIREKTIETYAKQLNESNRFLAESIKVQYKYKTLSDDSLSERQKRVICEQLDAHNNVETIGKIYETLKKSVGVGRNPNESLTDLGAKATKSTVFLREQKEKQESKINDFSQRLKKLAGIED